MVLAAKAWEGMAIEESVTVLEGAVVKATYDGPLDEGQVVV